MALLGLIRAEDASPQEKIAFDAAVMAFRDSAYERAAREFEAFIRNYPQSEHLKEVNMLLAHARAEGHLDRGEYLAAADAFAKMLKENPDYSSIVDAQLGEALARFKAGQWKAAADILRAPDSPFEKRAQSKPEDELVVRGLLLLAEIHLELAQYGSSEEILTRMAAANLKPDLQWQRHHLLTRLQLGTGKLDAAMSRIPGLLNLATNAGSRLFQAESVLLHGDIVRRQNQPDLAIQVYTNNLAEAVPAELRRKTILKIIDLLVSQERYPEAIQRLEGFLAQYPSDPAYDLLHYTVGELQLKEYFGRSRQERMQALGLLEKARGKFDLILTNQQSQLLGKARLTRGWCFWEEGELSGLKEKYGQGLVDFQAAATRLPVSEDQALAYFKLADCYFQLTNFPAAVSNYWMLIEKYADFPSIKTNLYEPALYQIIRASILAGGDLALAHQAMERILSWFPNSFFTDRSVLLFGQTLNRQGHPEEARSLFTEFIRTHPDSPWVAEIELAIARTHEQEGNWPAAIGRYEKWLETYTNHESRAQAEFYRALSYAQAGQATNALSLFTNFVARFPTNLLSAQAQNWVADFHFNRKDYVNADLNYQLLYQNTNWPQSELTLPAIMMAGRSAFARASYKDATNYFLALINPLKDSTNVHPLLAEAWFALGDTITSLRPEDPGRFERFREAIEPFSRIPETNRLAPLAWGRIAGCYLQLAAEDPKLYDTAAGWFKKTMNWPAADMEARSLAKIGLAVVLQHQAQLSKNPQEKSQLLREALDHYQDIIYGDNRRDENEPLSPFAVQLAGLAALRLMEQQERWSEAISLSQRLMQMLPPVRSTFQKRLTQAQEQLNAPKR